MKYIKKNAKYIGIVMVCVFCSYLTTIATNYIFDSSDVRFDNTGTSLESVNVQDAIDETFHHVTDYNEIKTTIGNNALTTTNQTLIGAINEVNGNLGLPSSASGVTGADAFSKINTLNTKITSDSGLQYIRLDGSNSYIVYRKIGNIVTVYAYHKVSSHAIAAWENMFFTNSFPTEYRPKIDQTARCVTDRSGSEGCAFFVNSNGNIYIAGRYTGASDINDILQASVTYAV